MTTARARFDASPLYRNIVRRWTVDRPATRWLVGGSVVVVCLAVVGLAWSVASAVGSSPDDDMHLSSIWCAGGAPSTQCVKGTPALNGRVNVLVPAAVSQAATGCFAINPKQTAVCQDAPRALTGLQPARANRTLYPGGYYTFMSVLVSHSVDLSVRAMRFLSWTVSSLLIAASVVVAPRPLRRTFLLALLVTLVPLTIFLLASVNPSGPTVAGTFACACACAALLSPLTTGRRTVAAGVVAVASAAWALVSRFDSGLWLILAIGSVALLTRAARSRRDIVPGAIVVVSGILLARFVLSGTPQDNWVAQTQDHPFSQVIWRNITDLPYLWTGSFGTWPLGWLDTPVPSLVWVGMIGCFSVVVAVGLGHPTRRQLAALGLIGAVLVAIPIYVMATDGSIIGQGVQPRYLLPLIPMVAVIALWPVPGRGGPLTPAQLRGIGGVVIVAHSVALHAVLHRNVSGLDNDGFYLDHMIEWWWKGGPSPMTVWALGSLAFAVLVAFAINGLRRWSEPELTLTTTQPDTVSLP